VPHGSIAPVASIWRNPVAMTFIDEDSRELANLTDPGFVPRVGENVRLAQIPYVVERIGYDVPARSLERIWVVCRKA
jgi:hypothetical protein